MWNCSCDPQLELVTGQDTDWPTLCPVGHSGKSCAAKKKGQALAPPSASNNGSTGTEGIFLLSSSGTQVNPKSAQSGINGTCQWISLSCQWTGQNSCLGLHCWHSQLRDLGGFLTQWAEWCVLIKAHLNSFVLNKYSCKGKVQAHNPLGELLSINFCCWRNTRKILERKKKLLVKMLKIQGKAQV